MTDTITIPATYAGNASYELEFRRDAEGVQVRAPFGKREWRTVRDLRWHPIDRDPERVCLTINDDMAPGPPIYGWVTPDDAERVKAWRGV